MDVACLCVCVCVTSVFVCVFLGQSWSWQCPTAAVAACAMVVPGHVPRADWPNAGALAQPRATAGPEEGGAGVRPRAQPPRDPPREPQSRPEVRGRGLGMGGVAASTEYSTNQFPRSERSNICSIFSVLHYYGFHFLLHPSVRGRDL